MKDTEFYKYRQSVKAFLSIALDGNVHSWALWEQIANQLELLWDNIDNRSGADLDFVIMYRDKLQDIRHGMQETYNDCGYDKKECGKRINTAIGGLVEKLNLTAARTGKEQPKPQQAGKFVPDSRLTTDKARAMFDAFEKAGFITKLEDGHLKWAKNKFSLKCFVDNAIKYLHLDKTKSPSGKVKKSWAIFEKLFVSDKFTTNRLQNYRINYVLSYDDNPESKEVQLIFNKNKTF